MIKSKPNHTSYKEHFHFISDIGIGLIVNPLEFDLQFSNKIEIPRLSHLFQYFMYFDERTLRKNVPTVLRGNIPPQDLEGEK